jgi:3-oxoadipate enol-lactonase
MPIIEIEAAAFNVTCDGDPGAPALLVANSLSSDLSMWDDQVPAWAERFYVIRYDGRGHGQSAVTPAPYTMDRLGRDAVAVLDALGVARAHFCGLSMGGMVGMWLLTHAPDRVNRAVLANTAAYMGPASLWDGRIALAQAGGMEATVEPTVQRWFPASFHAAAPAAIARMRAMIRRVPLEGYAGSCAAIRDMDQRDSIRAITAPTLVIVGAKDPATTPADGALIHAAIAGSRLATLDAAHLSNIEQPAPFTRTVLDFLAD